MAAPYNLLRSKLNRAIVAYLISVGAGSRNDTFAANVNRSSIGQHKPGNNTTVQATLSKPEPYLTANRRITVHVRIRGSATQSPKEPNWEAARTTFDERVGAVYDALLQSDNAQNLRATAQAITAAGRALAVADDPSNPQSVQQAANNADMVDFTCLGWYDMGEGDGEPQQEANAWEEVLVFDALCCGSNVD